MELDLLDFGFGAFGVGGALLGQFGGAGADAGVGAFDVVDEDLLGVVAGGGDSECMMLVTVVDRWRRQEGERSPFEEEADSIFA